VAIPSDVGMYSGGKRPVTQLTLDGAVAH
jgi:hypothetical protein